jgi:phosphoribosylformylglycinamidine (FGAM) synthase-like enzyme
VGKIDDVSKAASLSFKAAGEEILLIGETQGWLGQSMYLWQICGREEGAPPPVDLSAERRNGDFVRGLIHAGQVTAVHDLSDGGLAVALAEMAMAGKIGATVSVSGDHGFLFGEDQARYVLTASSAKASEIESAARAAGVPVARIGKTGGDTLNLAGEAPISIAELVHAYEDWLPVYMSSSK